MGAVVLSGWWGGLGPAIVCAGLSSAAADYFFLSKQRGFSFTETDNVSVTMFSAIATLITLLNERVRGRSDALTSNQRWLSATMSSIGDAVIATDPTGKVVLLNRVAESLTGWSVLDTGGREVSEVFKVISEVTRQPALIPVHEVIRA